MEGQSEKIRGILKQAGITVPPVDVTKVAELFSIPVIPYPDFPEDISGTIVRLDDNGKAVIGINQKHAAVRQRFTVAHELGHYLCGHDDRTIVDDRLDKDSPKETEANRFAAELLMPRDLLVVDLKKGRFDIPALAQRYQVSEQAMSVRLLQSGLLKKF